MNQKVTENDAILETERGNSSCSSNSKHKKETQTAPSSKKKKIVSTGEVMVNSISEKGLSVNQKVNIVHFLGGTSKDSIETGWHKEQPDDFIVHVGTNDLTNNVNL